MLRPERVERVGHPRYMYKRGRIGKLFTGLFVRFKFFNMADNFIT